MKKRFFVTLLLACLMVLFGYFLLVEEEAPAPTRTPVWTKAASAVTVAPASTKASSAATIAPASTKASSAATIAPASTKASSAATVAPATTKSSAATASGTRQASPTPVRTASPRPTLSASKIANTAAPVILTPATALVRFRVGVTTAYTLLVDPNAWEASGIPTPTGVAYSLVYKKLPDCRLLDEAGRDAPGGWTHINTSNSLGGRTYTLENWISPDGDQPEIVIFALDPRIRIQLSTASGNSECLKAAENVIAASTATLLTP